MFKDLDKNFELHELVKNKLYDWVIRAL